MKGEIIMNIYRRNKRSIKATNRPAPRRRAIKANMFGSPYEDIERSKDAFIQEWSNEYTGTPTTSWDYIFEGALEEFTRYADDEASGFIEQKFYDGELTTEDMLGEFEQFVMWRDLADYDVEY